MRHCFVLNFLRNWVWSSPEHSPFSTKRKAKTTGTARCGNEMFEQYRSWSILCVFYLLCCSRAFSVPESVDSRRDGDRCFSGRHQEANATLHGRFIWFLIFTHMWWLTQWQAHLSKPNMNGWTHTRFHFTTNKEWYHSIMDVRLYKVISSLQRGIMLDGFLHLKTINVLIHLRSRLVQMDTTLPLIQMDTSCCTPTSSQRYRLYTL